MHNTNPVNHFQLSFRGHRDGWHMAYHYGIDVAFISSNFILFLSLFFFFHSVFLAVLTAVFLFFSMLFLLFIFPLPYFPHLLVAQTFNMKMWLFLLRRLVRPRLEFPNALQTFFFFFFFFFVFLLLLRFSFLIDSIQVMVMSADNLQQQQQVS